jgi:two-component system, NarL family, sensor histidine kinase DegS
MAAARPRNQKPARPGKAASTAAGHATGSARGSAAGKAAGSAAGNAAGDAAGNATGSPGNPASNAARRHASSAANNASATAPAIPSAGGNNGHASGGQHLETVRMAAPAAHTSLIHDDPLDALLNEAQSAVSDGANTLRDVRERYRTAYLEQVEKWERLRTQTGASTSQADNTRAASHEAMAGREVTQERSTLGRIDLAVKSLENAWLFLAREDTSLVSDRSGPPSAADAQMRIVEAQEAERSRLAREVHDGPAQALSNAIFQVEVVQRLLDRDEAAAREELRGLRDVLTRELKGVRAYLSQLRPPELADQGLSGAIQNAANQTANALAIPVEVELAEGVDTLPETVEIVALRVIQEALQNARKHAQPTSIRIRMWKHHDGWTLEVRDDGRGFDSDDPPVSGRRHFGLQFMRERAELIGARFEVRSSPNLGTAVWMTIPPGAMGMPIPGEES